VVVAEKMKRWREVKGGIFPRIREKWSEGAYIINLEKIKLGNLQVGGYGKGLGVLNPNPEFYKVKDRPSFKTEL